MTKEMLSRMLCTPRHALHAASRRLWRGARRVWRLVARVACCAYAPRLQEDCGLRRTASWEVPLDSIQPVVPHSLPPALASRLVGCPRAGGSPLSLSGWPMRAKTPGSI